jgi:S-adenosylmethionine:tRNA ribosyltransferase-isomerase
VVDRARGAWHETTIASVPSLLTPGDLVVANDTRVFPARLIGRRDPSGGAVECMLLERESATDWQALVHPGQKLKPSTWMVFEDQARAPGVRIRAQIIERRFFGRRLVRLHPEGAADVDAAVDALGHMPLPPYIKREDTDADRARYQTVFARERGSVAAPTAGLHFAPETIAALRERGIGWSPITLHVGYGTFKPVRVDRVEEHTVDPERFEVPPAAAEAIAAAHLAGKRIIAVGTTTTRALESAAESQGVVRVGPGVADLFIYPGFDFKIIDGLLTNFHLPKSSLLMLVSAFAGRDLVLEAYRHAVRERFRFYSYGDAMLIL